MRSLIIIEVEHGEDTDELTEFATVMSRSQWGDVKVTDYSVKVDIPECFRL